MREVSTGGQVETHDTVVRVQESSVDCEVGRRTGVGLDVDTPRSGVEVERVEGSLFAEELELVDVFVASVVAGVGLALGVCRGGQRETRGFRRRERERRGKIERKSCVVRRRLGSFF